MVLEQFDLVQVEIGVGAEPGFPEGRDNVDEPRKDRKAQGSLGF